MEKTKGKKSKHPHLLLHTIALSLTWTALITAGLLWNIKHEREYTIETARIQARIAYEKDVIYRRWNTMHGGVYVPVTDETKPNPFMSNIPHRDIRTSSDRSLTLMNPDYMMRQVDELSLEEHDVRGHITSLNPTRKENSPDQWETKALESFDKGETEVSEIQKMEGQEYMRLIRPLITEEGCMQCHAKQVYKIGDIRGGLSVAIPMKPLYVIERKNLINTSIGIMFVWLLGIVGISFVGRRLVQSDRKRRVAEEQLMEQHAELQTANSELEILYKVSSAISQSIDMNELLKGVLVTIIGLEQFDVEHKGGIFIIEDDRMHLIAHLGHAASFIEMHKDMKVGDCLCGQVAKTGEIITSKNSNTDNMHTIKYPDMEPHGHIVVPLRTLNRVIGVLYLYTPPEIELDDHQINLLSSLGNQIGVALYNSQLYEETRKLTLEDPLTGLANRRFMDIMLKRSFAKAVRFKRPLSVIMLDIDHFKKYNDTHGHREGDKILVKLAQVLEKETREIDLAVRYGGEEFLVLLPETGLKSACEVAERIRLTVQTATKVTVSLGVTSYHENIHQDEIIEKADEALYKAKQNGRNRVEVID
jgi:diguanylate cyclase (GGDEF)-like protein